VYEIEILWKFSLKGDEKRVAPPETMRGYIFFLHTESTELFVLETVD